MALGIRPGRAALGGGSDVLAGPVPGLLAARPRPHEATQHLSDLDGAGAGRHHRIVCSERLNTNVLMSQGSQPPEDGES
jgi:hypothetical protein